MKVGIFSHCTMDTIIYENEQYDAPGGPASYCSITAKKQKHDVNLYTKFGANYPLEEFFNENKINMHDALSSKDTTKFRIELNNSDRKLFVENMCDNIDFIENNDDGTIISPVFDEISLDTYSQIKNSDNFTFLDPQGFLREKNSDNEVSLKRTSLDLANIDAIKMNPDELFALTGLSGHDGIKQLQKLGIEYVIHTNKQEISLLVKDKLYTIFLPKMTLTDTTGIGDIFCSTFTCTMLKEKDFLWALSFAGGAAQSALESKAFGLEKVPEKNALESNGSYFYNIVEFKQI
ncbi:MAG: PfkB family carbohydrate kinase [Thermoproteota archaeon]|jgi:sugar/nucleoside kinase (ribokinase family)|nr:PfkB family carbohydrate kinase [Thermoproteota archaeon]MEC9033141.1 PfkB family carbohydrate kinase [Thermoproteota archaeon]MEC9073844.1 PfkB family carbohydrate kinase [Thermoproteota archaeon]MED5282689.1 PfkB family carbohydrate kinase [Thermoproteota archaeon]|tara:strand:- start:516 stop:1388 length:873 start_codon:yes stop_codon:yes gene_type:complete